MAKLWKTSCSNTIRYVDANKANLNESRERETYCCKMSQCSDSSHWIIYSINANILSLCLSLAPLVHSPMLTRLPMQRADSVMSVPESPIPHHFPQGSERKREREKVKEWMLDS